MEQNSPNISQSRFTEDELRLIRDTFKGNEPLLRLMGKFFCPPLDPQAPPGLMFDIYMQIPADQMTDADAARNLRARNLLINHLNMRLIELQILSERKDETPKEREERMKKDSVK